MKCLVNYYGELGRDDLVRCTCLDRLRPTLARFGFPGESRPYRPVLRALRRYRYMEVSTGSEHRKLSKARPV